MTAAGRDRILVVGKPYLGDTVLALPVLRSLRAAFPGHAIDMLVEGGSMGDFLAGCPHVDEVLAWERPPRPRLIRGLGRRPWLASLASVEVAAAVLRPRGYARAYLLKRSPSAALLAIRAGIPHRVGHATVPGGPFLTRSVPWRRDRHHRDRLLDLLRADGLDVADPDPRYWGVEPATAARVTRLLAPLPVDRRRVFLAVRATDWRRQWPLDRWVAVVRRLVADHRCEIVFCGGPDDARAVAGIVGSLGATAAHAHDLSAALPLGDVPALLARMDLYLGVNSGLMHLAAACGTPVTAVFDPADAAAWLPLGAGHAILCGASRRRHAGRGAEPEDPTRAAGEALLAVTVDEVVDRVAACLATRPAAIRALDLRTGGHRYAVELRPAAPAESVSAGA